MAYRAVITILAVLLAASLSVQAGGSVFSANGVGEEQIGGGVRSLGLGGGGFGLADTLGFNTSNPALMAFLPRTEMRIGGHVAFWNTTANNRTDSDAEVMWKDLGLFFPVSNRWRIGLGIRPSLRQDVHTIAIRTAVFPDTSATPPIVPEQPYEERLTWSGGTADVRLDNAYRFSEKLALGASVIYSMLHDERSTVLDFPNTDVRGVSLLETGTFRGWSFSVGGYYAPAEQISVGAYFRPRLKGNWTFEVDKANADSSMKRDGTADAPGEFAVGLSYRVSSRVVGVADVRLGSWQAGDYGETFQSLGSSAPTNPLFISVGVERKPRRGPVYGGLNLWGYRGGAFFRRNYWTSAEGQSVTDAGVSLGFSIPVAQASGWFHTAAELGQRGFDEKKLGATELFARISIQLEVGETWFQRAKPRVPE